MPNIDAPAHFEQPGARRSQRIATSPLRRPGDRREHHNLEVWFRQRGLPRSFVLYQAGFRGPDLATSLVSTKGVQLKVRVKQRGRGDCEKIAFRTNDIQWQWLFS